MRSEKSAAPSAVPGRLIDQGAPSQFVERQGRVDPARKIEVAVDQAVEEMTDVEPADPAGGVRVADDIDRAAVGQQMIEFGVIGEFVDPREVDQQQPARILGRGVEPVEIRRLSPVIGTYAHDVTLVAYHVDQLELLEHGGDGRKTFAHLRPRLDGDAQRRRIVENEAHEGMPDRPLGEVRYVEVEGDEVRQQDFTLLVPHREIVAGAVVEIADARQAHAVAVDHGPRHDSHFRTPVAIVRGRNGDPPDDHAEKQHGRDDGHAPLTGKPQRPDRERCEGHCKSEAQFSPRQIGIIDGQRGPQDRQGQAKKTDGSDQPAN